MLSGLVAGVTSLTAGKAFADATPVDLFDDRAAKSKGFEIIYEARDLDLPQNERDGISQFRGDLSATKARYTEAERRINTKLGEYVSSQYWYVHPCLVVLPSPCPIPLGKESYILRAWLCKPGPKTL